MRRTLFIGLAFCFAALAVAALSFYLYGRPTLLRVAVAQGSIDQELMQEAARILPRELSPLRFAIVPVNDAAAAAKAIDSGTVELAIIASDQALPAKAKTAVVMRKAAVFLIAPSGSKVNVIADLAGKTIGIMQDGSADIGRERILDIILARHDLPVNAAARRSVTITDAEAALKTRQIDVIFVAGVPGEGLAAETVHAAAMAGGGEPIFIPVGHASALAQQSLAFETLTIPAGTFIGATSRPAQDFETVALSVRLFASTSLRDSVVGLLARAMFSLKPKLAMTHPAALRIQAPSTYKDAALPTHPGAAAYLDSEEENIFDRFSELFYLSAMGLSIIGSAVAAVASYFSSGAKREHRAYVARLLEILRSARLAGDSATLRLLQLETDNIFAEFMPAAAAGKHDEQRVSTLGLIVGQVHQALLDRRVALGEPPIGERAITPAEFRAAA